MDRLRVADVHCGAWLTGEGSLVSSDCISDVEKRASLVAVAQSFDHATWWCGPDLREQLRNDMRLSTGVFARAIDIEQAEYHPFDRKLFHRHFAKELRPTVA